VAVYIPLWKADLFLTFSLAQRNLLEKGLLRMPIVSFIQKVEQMKIMSEKITAEVDRIVKNSTNRPPSPTARAVTLAAAGKQWKENLEVGGPETNIPAYQEFESRIAKISAERASKMNFEEACKPVMAPRKALPKTVATPRADRLKSNLSVDELSAYLSYKHSFLGRKL
jgi:hypothetical protein